MPIILAFIKAFWKPILVITTIIVLILSARIYASRQYDAGVNDATITFQERLNKLNLDQQQQMAEASKRYQEQKTIRDKNQEIQYVEVEKIVQQPVYLTDCIDADGVREINRAAASK